MQREPVTLIPFGPEHLDGAWRLSQQAKWPHRREDWAMGLALSQGFVAVTAAGAMVGTVLLTPYKHDTATINMVIVDESQRGQGLGRRLMAAVLPLAGSRPLRLIATQEGLPLYQKLGFIETGRIVQHQGIAAPLAAPAGVTAGDAADIPAIAALDRAAFAADREGLMGCLANLARFAVLRQGAEITGYAALRAFGRGEVIGPVVANSLADAQALIAFFIAARPGAFLRVDTPAESGLAPWLTAQGLAPVGGGVTMQRPLHPAPTASLFALANQALG